MILWILLFTTSIWAKELSVLTLNLHGYHPMGEERRVLHKNSGGPELSWSHLHYFNQTELTRGLEKRQKILASHLANAKADIIFLQEIGGGVLHQKKTCSDFRASNTAEDLRSRLGGYRSWIGCRGNLGWWTDARTFESFSVYTENTQQLVMSRGQNPYPFALMMEGLAILTSPSVEVLGQREEALSINSSGERFFLQLLKFRVRAQRGSGWWIAVNIHGGHKVQNFEQAVSARRFLSQYINSQTDREKFAGFIVAGDFNALLPQSEVSTVPWSFFHAWQTPEGLTSDLLRLNSSGHKPFATLPQEQALPRIKESVQKFFEWFSWARQPQDGSLNEVTLNSNCVLLHAPMNPYCGMKDKIDHIFVSNEIRITRHSAVYRQNNWIDLETTTSDHPGLVVQLVLQDQ